MSEENSREEARVYIKKLVDFNIKNDYYQKDKKEELARDLRKLLFVDDPTVRQFLEKLILATREVAREFDLVGTEQEVQTAEEEKTSDEENQDAESTEEAEQEEKPEDETAGEQPVEAQAEDVPVEATSEESPIPKLPENYVYENTTVKRASELVDDLLGE